jgi:hypothetical protein
MLHVHVHAACPCLCCMSMSMLTFMSMLQVYVRAACPRPCCMFMSMLHVHVKLSILLVHVHTAFPCPCYMSNCPCPCFMSKSMLHVHVNAVCLHPCCITMPTRDMDMDTVTVMVIDTDTDASMSTNRGMDEWKQIFWSEWKWIEVIFRFLDSLCFEANILQQINANWSKYFYMNIHESRRTFRLGFASVRFIVNNWKKRIWTP